MREPQAHRYSCRIRRHQNRHSSLPRFRKQSHRRQRQYKNCICEEAPHHFTSTAGAIPPSPVPDGGPNINFFPSANVISRECAQFVPSRARHTATVTRSPIFIVVSRFHPSRDSTLGG